MMSYALLSKKPGMFRTFTGLSIEEFDRLYQIVENRYEDYERKRLSREDRKKRIGQGRRFKLKLIDRLLMLLVSYEKRLPQISMVCILHKHFFSFLLQSSEPVASLSVLSGLQPHSL